MKRQLGGLEQAAILSGEKATWNIVSVLQLTPAPEPNHIQQALEIQTARQPLLRACVNREGRQRFFTTLGVPNIPLTIDTWTDPEDWLPVVNTELNLGFDHQTGPLVRLTYLSQEPEQATLILTAQHAIADAQSLGQLLQEILGWCATFEHGAQPPKLEPQPIAPAVASLFPPSYQGRALRVQLRQYFLGQMKAELQYQWQTRRARRAPVQPSARAFGLSFQTPVDLTERLVKRCRQARISVNSLLQAILLACVQEQLYSGEAGLYRYMAMADLRPYLEPPAPATHLGCYISPLRYTAALSRHQEVWPLAHQIQEQLYRGAKGGEKYLAAAMARQFMQMTFGLGRFRMCASALSYNGPSQLESLHGPYRVTGLHGFISNFGLGPEFSARVGLFEDQVVWDMVYLDSDLDASGAQQLVATLQAMLSQAAG